LALAARTILWSVYRREPFASMLNSSIAISADASTTSSSSSSSYEAAAVAAATLVFSPLSFQRPPDPRHGRLGA
jgi:hypothetical protein